MVSGQHVDKAIAWIIRSIRLSDVAVVAELIAGQTILSSDARHTGESHQWRQFAHGEPGEGLFEFMTRKMAVHENTQLSMAPGTDSVRGGEPRVASFSKRSSGLPTR